MKNITRIVFLLLFTASTFAHAQDEDYVPAPNSNRNPRGHQSPQRPPRKEVINDNPKGFVAVNFGSTIPEGNFSNNTGIRYGNYAIQGNAYNLSAGIPLSNSNFGIAIMLGQSFNAFDMDTYMSNFVNSPSVQSTMSPGTLASPNSAYGPNSDINNPFYDETHVMAGLFYTFPIRRFSFDLRGLIGVSFCSLPTLSLLVGPNQAEVSDEWDLIPNHTNTTAFSYDLGAGIRYLLPFMRRRSTCIMLNADIFQSSAGYNVNETHYTQMLTASPTASSSTIVGTQQISLLTFSLGIGMQFEQK